jgi:zinc protease
MNKLAGQFISDQNRVIIVEGPEKDKDKLPDEKTILNWIGTAGNNISAYVDNVTSKPLMDKEPEGSKAVSEVQDEAIGITTLTLGNGLKVILKPTEFKNDQILINGYSFGGSSLANDNDYTSASFGASIVAVAVFLSLTRGSLIKCWPVKTLMLPHI